MKKRTLPLIAASLVTTLSFGELTTDSLLYNWDASDLTLGNQADGSTWGSNASGSGSANIEVVDTSASFNVDVVSAAGYSFDKAVEITGFNQTIGLNTGFLTSSHASNFFTVEIWVNPAFPNPPSNPQVLFETGGASKGVSITIGDNDSDGNDDIRFAAGSSSDNKSVDAEIGSTSFYDGNFHQIVASYGSSGLTLYLNGQSVGSIAGTIGDWEGSNDAGILTTNSQLGANLASLAPGNDDGSFGQLGIVRFYEDALTASEVLGNFDATATAIPEPSHMTAIFGLAGLCYLFARRKTKAEQ